MKEMKFHKYSHYLPLVEGEEYKKLVEDIRKNGLLEAIWTYEGQILDGRNRYRACKDAGVKPRYREYDGDSPMAFVVSMNVRRRHLTIGQLSLISLKVLPELEKEFEKRKAVKVSASRTGAEVEEGLPPSDIRQARDFAGEIFGISGRAVGAAKSLDEESKKEDGVEVGDLIEEVASGELGVHTAEKEMRKRIAQRKKAEDKLAHPEPMRWQDVPEVKQILNAMKAWRKRMPEYHDALDVGKFSPEAKLFLAEKLNDVIREVEALASALKNLQRKLQ